MKHIVSVSGGIASATSAFLAQMLGLDFDMVFADTLIEDEDLYRFNSDLSATLRLPIIRLCDGRDPWQVFVDKRFIGNSRTAHCSSALKTAQVRKYIESIGVDCTLVLGMYRDEEDRLERARKAWGDIPVISLLIERKVTPKRAGDVLAAHGIKEPRLYAMGFPHNNCGGMCVRAGQAQFNTLLKRKRAFYLDQERREESARDSIGASARGFIRVRRGGATSYLTMREFREAVEKGEIEPNLYEFGGCGCFVDEDAIE
jgi:hypothetical protein